MVGGIEDAPKPAGNLADLALGDDRAVSVQEEDPDRALIAAPVVIALGADGSVAPDWVIGLAAGLGGLAGGYLGARWSTSAPERALRLLLGGVAMALAATYVVVALG